VAPEVPDKYLTERQEATDVLQKVDGCSDSDWQEFFGMLCPRGAGELTLAPEDTAQRAHLAAPIELTKEKPGPRQSCDRQQERAKSI
jgi:hypothetical protein